MLHPDSLLRHRERERDIRDELMATMAGRQARVKRGLRRRERRAVRLAARLAELSRAKPRSL